MKKRSNNILFTVSLCVLAIGTLINSFYFVFAGSLPEVVPVVIGVVDLIAVFILVFVTVSEKKNNKIRK